MSKATKLASNDSHKSWINYWNKQTDARHASTDPHFHKKLAEEMAFHMGEIGDSKVLEIGCGDGSLIPYLSLSPANYTGIDFSKSLLEIFHNTHPEYSTKPISALEYLQNCTEKYDLIFSFGVLQYFDTAELSTLFTLQNEALSTYGKACHFGVPVRELQSLFSAGQGVQHISNFKPRPLLKQFKSRVTNNIGHWHKLNDLHQTSTNSGYTTNIIGGMNYLYRVNVIQQTSHEQRSTT